jgi:RES domain-containing protein
VVYAAESLSLAVLEILAGGADLSLLDLYVKIPADFDDAAVTILEAPPQGWKSSPPGYATQAIGDRWVREGSGVILRVPSVVVDGEYNFLINPQHPLFPRTVTVGTPAVFRFDPRLG